MPENHWDKPPRITATINKALVAQSLSAHVPTGNHDHDDRENGYGAFKASGTRLRRSGQPNSGWPRTGGRLQRFIGHIANWHFKDKQQACYISIFLPYVRAINWGAVIPAVSFEGKPWRMHWSDGGPVYRKARRGYTIQGQHFLERGIDEFAQRSGVTVTWSKGTDTA